VPGIATIRIGRFAALTTPFPAEAACWDNPYLRVCRFAAHFPSCRGETSVWVRDGLYTVFAYLAPRGRRMQAAMCRRHTLIGRRLPIAQTFPSEAQAAVTDAATWVGRKFEKAATASARTRRARLYGRIVCWIRTALVEE
jgi:hypothetical protein